MSEKNKALAARIPEAFTRQARGHRRGDSDNPRHGNCARDAAGRKGSTSGQNAASLFQISRSDRLSRRRGPGCTAGTATGTMKGAFAADAPSANATWRDPYHPNQDGKIVEHWQVQDSSACSTAGLIPARSRARALTTARLTDPAPPAFSFLSRLNHGRPRHSM